MNNSLFDDVEKPKMNARLRKETESKLLGFVNRTLKGNKVFTISEIENVKALKFVKGYHYLGDSKFLSMYSFGLFCDNVLVGVATFGTPQGSSTLKGWFGLDNSNTDIMELTRLCMLPILSNSNASSFLLGNSIRLLKKKKIRAVISLADSSRHIGSIYQICNFKYYGLSDYKTDFYAIDGRVNPRGETKNVRGVWMPRTQKHRYGYILDKNLKCFLTEHPNPNSLIGSKTCCDNGRVFDKRFNEYHTCPICRGK